MRLGIVIPTYNRADILLETISRLESYLLTPDMDKTTIIVGIDGDDDTLDRLHQSQTKLAPFFARFHLVGPGRGLGANLNACLRAAKEIGCDFILQMDDDHQLQHRLDMRPYLRDMAADPHLGWIRLYYGEYRGRGSGVERYYQFRANLYGQYWRLDPFGPELYLTSNRPHLKRMDFHDTFGYYAEDIRLGATEVEFCHRYLDQAKNGHVNPGVFIPLYPPPEGTWRHVGDSWQKQGL